MEAILGLLFGYPHISAFFSIAGRESQANEQKPLNKVGGTGSIMNPIESMLDAHEIPFIAAEQDERYRIKVLGMDKIGDVGATHYRGQKHILSLVDFSDGYEMPVALAKYLKMLSKVQDKLKHLTAQGDCDYRIIPAMGLYVEQEGPTFSMPLDFNGPLIVLAVLFSANDDDDEAVIEYGGQRLVEISMLFEQALQAMGINIE